MGETLDPSVYYLAIGAKRFCQGQLETYFQRQILLGARKVIKKLWI